QAEQYADPRSLERLDHTAYTLRSGEFSVGLDKGQLGVLDHLQIGTYLLPWFVFPWTSSPIPSGIVKLRMPIAERVALSVQASGIYLSSDALRWAFDIRQETRGSLFVLPVEAAFSLALSPVWTQSGSLTYVASGLQGGTRGNTRLWGAVISSALTFSTYSEFRLSPMFAISLLSRILLRQGGTRVTAEVRQGATTVNLDIGAGPSREILTCVIPGVELSFGMLHMNLGLGYGSYWIPAVELPVSTAGLVPDVSAYLRF
ncbi:MAG TPA: hypothetical protein VFQ61_24785, partial [Polyangiaceae bacterium]|nr:hypothetical protein [Polyangiaceae bacterium]